MKTLIRRAAGKRVPAIVLGEKVTALATVRSLGRLGIPVYLFGAPEDDPATASKFLHEHGYGFATAADAVVENVLAFAATRPEKPVLICTADKFIEAVARRRREIDEVARIKLPDAETVDTVVDKAKFGDFCRANGFPAPRTWAPTNPREIEQCLAEAEFPVAVKPVFSHAAEGLRLPRNGAWAKLAILEDRDALRRSLQEFRALDLDVVVQEYIEGPDDEHYSFISYRNEANEELFGFGVRKLRIYPIHGGAASFVEISNDTELASQARAVVDRLGYTGISSICFKRNSRTGRLVIHEANGRLPVWHSASALCGIDISRLIYEDSVTNRAAPQPVNRSRRKWMAMRADVGAFLDYRRCGELGLTEWLRSLLGVRVCAEFAIDDLRPFVLVAGALFQRARRRINRPPQTSKA